MKRLTLEDIEKIKEMPYGNIIQNGTIKQMIYELDQYKQIEEKLGCSLDIIFDALYRGIVCTPHPFYTHEKIYPKKEYNIVQLFQFYYLKVEDGVVDIKDYGKTWWLKED